MHPTRSLFSEYSTTSYTGFLSVLGLFNHLDRLGGTLFGANAASFAVIEVDFHGNGAFDHALGTVKPADEARRALVFGGSASAMVDFGPEGTPVSRFARFSLAQFGMGVNEAFLFLVAHQSILPEITRGGS